MLKDCSLLACFLSSALTNEERNVFCPLEVVLCSGMFYERPSPAGVSVCASDYVSSFNKDLSVENTSAHSGALKCCLRLQECQEGIISMYRLCLNAITHDRHCSLINISHVKCGHARPYPVMHICSVQVCHHLSCFTAILL